jgi:hypothetical protein
MKFDWTMNIGQVVQFGGLVLTFVGLFLTYMQLRKSQTVNTAEILKDVMFKFFGDDQIQKTYYRVGEGQFKFDLEEFKKPGSDTERSIDQLLYLFECVGKLHALGLIKPNDILLRYRMTKVFNDPEVQAYMRYLDEEIYPRTLGKGAKCFRHARELVRVLSQEPHPDG